MEKEMIKELELFMKQFISKFNDETQKYFMDELLSILKRFKGF